MSIKKVVIVIFILLTGCSKSHFFYIEHAKMDSLFYEETNNSVKNRPIPAKLLLDGHYIREGNSVVLLLRKFNVGDLFTIDDEYFEKLTIEIKKFKIGIPIPIGSEDIKIYYSKGGSGWVSRGAGVYSSSGFGSITILKLDKFRLIALIDISLKTRNALTSPVEEGEKRFHSKFVFHKMEIDELTPWLGIPGKSAGSEAYP